MVEILEIFFSLLFPLYFKSYEHFEAARMVACWTFRCAVNELESPDDPSASIWSSRSSVSSLISKGFLRLEYDSSGVS